MLTFKKLIKQNGQIVTYTEKYFNNNLSSLKSHFIKATYSIEFLLVSFLDEMLSPKVLCVLLDHMTHFVVV